jgi:ligand-binding sensor domain-containing protein
MLPILSVSCFAQQFSLPPLKFEHITSDQGLSNRSILAMMKDSKGFLWITTIDGVNRYDGMDFKIFRNDPFDSTTLSSGWAYCISEDKNGTIWMGGDYGIVLDSYNPLTGKFKRYADDPYLKKLLPDYQITYLYAD